MQIVTFILARIESGACLILLPRGSVLIQGKALFIACIELIPRKSFVYYFLDLIQSERSTHNSSDDKIYNIMQVHCVGCF